ncbi:MAG: leucine--tRNA ligase [bacterium]
MQQYSPKNIETKWQKIWDESGVYKADLNSSKPKYIAMSMFNYPSGAGIHIGHAMNYTISDVKARYKRQKGFESYHPVGWDSFGLPAENYAIKTGVSPQKSMAKIIPDYHKQYKAMGWSNDWSKEIATHEPDYYKWTQWLFVQLYNNGLAYQDSRMQWWCDKCQTVLANEQVIDGKCWRHDGSEDPLVDKKEVKQWFFKITDYADELLESIEDLNWSEVVKIAQHNWIGKSVGGEIDFKIDGIQDSIKVFTTRPDTLAGATFLVLAPEHHLVEKLTSNDNKKQVEDYVKATQQKSDVERQASKEKSGVFTGSYAINPITDKQIPIWIAEYVLVGYGTGAIMSVPAHDERDWEFAKQNNLEIIRVISNDEPDDACTTSEGLLINSDKYDGLKSDEAREKILTDLARGGVGSEKINYKMRDWSVSRQRYWGAPIPIINCKDCGVVLVPDEDLPVILPELTDFRPSGDGRSALARAKDWVNVKCPKCHKPAERETDTMDGYICSSWYMLRYLDPHNSDKIFDTELANKWMPVDFYNGGDHATAHLLYARFITRFLNKQGLVNNPEPFDKMLFNGKVSASDGTAFSKSKGNGVDPLEIIESGYGADALRVYLMFAAPLEIGTKWDPQGVPGAYRFLNRLWNISSEYVEQSSGDINDETTKTINKSVHSMIKKVDQDLENNLYNTAISAMMGCLNDLYKIKVESFNKCSVWDEALKSLVACVAPFAPHIAEELWHLLGEKTSVHADSWPKLNEKYLVEDQITVVVQVNGKVRSTILTSKDSSEEEVVNKAKKDQKVATYLQDQNIKKTIYVPGKLVSFVI